MPTGTNAPPESAPIPDYSEYENLKRLTDQWRNEYERFAAQNPPATPEDKRMDKVTRSLFEYSAAPQSYYGGIVKTLNPTTGATAESLIPFIGGYLAEGEMETAEAVRQLAAAGRPMTEREQHLHNALVTANLRQQMPSKFTEQISEMAMTSLPYSAEFLLGNILTKGLIRGGIGLLSKVGRAIRGGRAVARASEAAAKPTAIMRAGRVFGESIVQTPFHAGRINMDYLNRIATQMNVNPKDLADVVYSDGGDPELSLQHSVVSTVLENLTERMGGKVAKAFFETGARMGINPRVLTQEWFKIKNDVHNELRQFINQSMRLRAALAVIEKMKKDPTVKLTVENVNKVLKSAEYGGTTAEVIEEMWNRFFQQGLGVGSPSEQENPVYAKAARGEYGDALYEFGKGMHVEDIPAMYLSFLHIPVIKNVMVGAAAATTRKPGESGGEPNQPGADDKLYDILYHAPVGQIRPESRPVKPHRFRLEP